MTVLNPIISATELLALKENKSTFILFDASNEPTAKTRYEDSHLENALFINTNTDLANPPQNFAEGGRHPLPSTTAFIKTLRNFGVEPANHLIIYDYKSGANAAARFWWMLKAIGHEKVQVLDGGFQKAEEIGYPIHKEIQKVVKSEYPIIKNWILPIATLPQVIKASLNNGQTIIDVREAARYNGEQEPIDLIGGHIPNAVNRPFINHLKTDGTFKTKAELKVIYGLFFDKPEPQQVIVHCGSGITACHTLLAMAIAQFKLPNLYVGSWSEWSRNNKPIATNLNK